MVHDAAAAGCRQQADTYAKARPSYPDLIARFGSEIGHGTVADLGAETEIFTGQLIAAGVTPIAVEPSAQAFHWFDHPRALAKIRRVLAPAVTSSVFGMSETNPSTGCRPTPRS